MQQFPVRLIVFQNVADIAGSYSERLCSDNRILRCNDTVLHRKKQIRLENRIRLNTFRVKQRSPYLKIRCKNKYQRSLCDKWLMITSLCQDFLPATAPQ